MLSFFPRGVLDEILNLIESASEGFPSYSSTVLILKYVKNINNSIITVRVFLDRLSICVCTSFHFDFEGGMWDLIVLVPDHCLSFYFT